MNILRFFQRKVRVESLPERDFHSLATYNAEVSRGLVHTPEWKQEMAKLQHAYDLELEEFPRCGPFVIIPPNKFP